MSNKILIKKTSTPGKIPLSTDLDIGELALNMNDSILFFKDASNNIKQISGGSSGSDPLKQDLLVSGTNIKTVNNQSILGPGNLDVAGGSGTQNVYIQETEPDIGVGAKALWIQTVNGKFTMWLKEN